MLVLMLLSQGGCGVTPHGTAQVAGHRLLGALWDPSGQRFINQAELLGRASQAEVLLLGETHDNPEHHRLQAHLLQARLTAGAKPALLMEQFDTDQQALIDQARGAGQSLASLLRGWDWSHYASVVALADAAGVPVLAANLSRNAIRPVVRDGYSSLPAGELQRLALDQVWDAQRQAYMARLIEESHCGKISPALRDGLVRAQRLRDATLADTALAHLERGVVFILGRGHARRDVAVPRYLQARRPGTRVLSVGFVEVSDKLPDPAQYEHEQLGGMAAFDVIWFTSRAQRADPCLAFDK
ncbi:ChaN family lipoprotein [Rhodoferax sp.]|uniref:ChaN family lipoprotein n=1 Tax=Rhodoferax sp. TaxID=50421 RepID=UPI0027794D23|nr:ChaN family lipoprotein [Rhodoferax sp.]